MKTIDELIKFDALDTAEQITGTRCQGKDGFDDTTMAIGIALMQENAAERDAALREVGDTVHGDSLARYLTIIDKYGFEKVLEDEFLSNYDVAEKYLIYAHRKGILLSFDTYDGKTINGGNAYYNWRPSSIDIMDGCTSSGSFHNYDTDPVWIGSHDCRQALIHNINKMDNRGEFVTPWVKRPFLWLLHYQDSKVDGYDYKAITAERISRLPDWVREFIGG